MKVRILPSSSDVDLQYLTSFLVGDTVAIDAGCLGYQGQPGSDPVDHVFLTHSHLDHVGSLPIYLENRARPVSVYGQTSTLDALRSDFFNDRIWPDIFRRDADIRNRIRMIPLESEVPVQLGDLRVTPVEVDHTVPTFGFLVEGPGTAVVFGSDAGPTDRIWEMGRATGRVKAAFIECSFPDRLSEFARKSAHLTPRLLKLEAAKLPPETTVIPVHVKPRYRAEVVEELLALGLPKLEVGEAGKDYVF